jgi:hypothetical protein
LTPAAAAAAAAVITITIEPFPYDAILLLCYQFVISSDRLTLNEIPLICSYHRTDE